MSRLSSTHFICYCTAHSHFHIYSGSCYHMQHFFLVTRTHPIHKLYRLNGTFSNDTRATMKRGEAIQETAKDVMRPKRESFHLANFVPSDFYRMLVFEQFSFLRHTVGYEALLSFFRPPPHASWYADALLFLPCENKRQQ